MWTSLQRVWPLFWTNKHLTKETYFSNSLIIHQVKIKKIITVKEVWILWILTILLSHLLFHFIYFILSFFLSRRSIKHSRHCFIGTSKTWNFVKTTSLLVVFLIVFSVFGFPDETLSLVCDIYHVYGHGWSKPRGKWRTLWNSTLFQFHSPLFFRETVDVDHWVRRAAIVVS